MRDNSQVEFLLQVLQATADSGGDAKVIYPLLEANQEKLDMNFAQVLRNWATATLLLNSEIEKARSIAAYIFNFSNLMVNFPLAKRANNLEIAITGYEIVLTVFTQNRFPKEWATTYNNLGNTYSQRIKGEKAANLEMAISCYEAALQVRTSKRFPYEWARTQNNLGNAYRNRIQGEKADNLEQAIFCYKQALQVCTRDRFPMDWAMTQNNLGNAYLYRIKGEKAANLEQAIFCYQQALQEYTRDRFPQKWAMLQNNLGNAYCGRIKGEKTANLEQAIFCYQQALQEYTRDRFPYEWAMAQNNLGAAYRNRIKGDKTTNLEQAISYFQEAVQEYTRDALPQNHVTTSFNLGLVYIDAKRFGDAYNIFNSAIETVEFLRDEIVSGDEVKQKLAEEWNKLYHCMVEVCLKLKYYDQAVEYMERSKTRNLVELLASQGTPEIQQLQQTIIEEKRSLEVAQNLEATHLNQLRQQRENLINQVIPLEHIRFGEITQMLDERTAIVQWYIFDDCFRAFIITRQRQTPQIWKSTTKDLKALDNWSQEYLETYNKDKPSWRPQLPNQLQRLAEILHINDILALVPDTCQALIFVPHRFLHLLPLHALPLAQEGKYLVDKFSLGVRYAPSCQLLKLAKQRNYQPQQSLFAIQNPTEDLINTNIEVETIARDFQPTKIIEKANATKEYLLQAGDHLRNAQVVHFSCHGYFDIESPVNSAILLAEAYVSPLPTDANAENRYLRLANGDAIDLEKCLTLADIFKLNLPECRLVTLSACETGLTNPNSTSDEYIGLPSGFLKAGCSSVVSSLWSVDDFATALLMIRFYDNLHTLPIAQALCEAQCWLRNATQLQLIEWSQNHKNINEQNKQTIQKRLQKWYLPDEKPFNQLEAWAGFCAIGH